MDVSFAVPIPLAFLACGLVGLGIGLFLKWQESNYQRERRARWSGQGSWVVVEGRRWEGRFAFREVDRFNASGSARVYRGLDAKDRPVCVKVAPACGQLYNDGVVWTHLEHTTGGWEGLPKLRACLFAGDAAAERIIVSELCGESLDWCLKRRLFRRRRFTLMETCAVGLELLRNIRHLHRAGYVHRDVSLANFLLPRYPPSAGAPLLYIVDFGISQLMSPYVAKRAQDASGTLRFASVNIGVEPLGWRDDLQSLGFVLLACLRGELPWDEEACRPCPRRDANRQRRAVAAAKLKLIRSGSVRAVPGIEHQAAKLVDAFFSLLDGLAPEDYPPYDRIEQLLRGAGSEAAGRLRSFPPAHLFELLPIRYRMWERLKQLGRCVQCA